MRHLLLPLLLISALVSHAGSHYQTIHNRFSALTTQLARQLSDGLTHEIVNDRLLIDNGTGKSICLTEPDEIEGDYKYLVRLGALNNKPGAYRVAWGIVFNWRDSLHYDYIEVRCINSALYDDITDHRQMRVDIYRHAGSHRYRERLARQFVDKGVDLYDGLNTLAVTVSGNEASVEIGNKRLQHIANIHLDREETARVGLLISDGTQAALERTVLTTSGTTVRRHDSGWTRDALEQHFAQSRDPIEGFWQYQDRDMEEKWLRLGGRYTIAVVAAEQGYDIIYISGAQVKERLWSTGLTKGHIDRTIFDGHYDLKWIDATFEAITQDAYATFDNGVLMTLNFPLYKSQVRFSKILKP